MVNIDVYVMVHNEEKMLPYFLRHYGSFAQHIYAFEDQSTDKSWYILDAHPLVTIINPDVHGIDEAYWTSVLWATYEEKSCGRADWVMLVDADEFIYKRDLITFLGQEKLLGTRVLKCSGYTMVSDHFPTTDEQIYCEVSMGLPDRMSSKAVVFDPSIHIRFGNGLHNIRELTEGVEAKRNTGIKLLHYRYLGKEYFEERDRKNRPRFNLPFGLDIPYDPNRRHTQPDGKRGVRLNWYAEHFHEAVNVVDNDD